MSYPNWDAHNGRHDEIQPGSDCSCCKWARPLPDPLALDYIICTNPKSLEHHYHVLFEHHTCLLWEWDEDGWNEMCSELGEDGKDVIAVIVGDDWPKSEEEVVGE